MLTDQVIYLLVSISIFIKCLLELNPFIRYDGYWILSDLTNVPNLLPKSKAFIKLFLKNKSLKQLGRKDRLIVIYGIVNWLVIITYLLWLIQNIGFDILYFPERVFQAIIRLTESLDLTLLSDLMTLESLLILGFYMLTLKIGIAITRRIYKAVITKPDFKWVRSGEAN